VKDLLRGKIKIGAKIRILTWFTSKPIFTIFRFLDFFF